MFCGILCLSVVMISAVDLETKQFRRVWVVAPLVNSLQIFPKDGPVVRFFSYSVFVRKVWEGL